jgi:hypothetical protein
VNPGYRCAHLGYACYRTVRGQIDPKTRVRRLYQVDLWEISIVTFPLLNGARVSAVKQQPKLSRLREAAEAEWRAMLAGQDVSAPRAPPMPLAARLGERGGRKSALRGVARADGRCGDASNRIN